MLLFQWFDLSLWKSEWIYHLGLVEVRDISGNYNGKLVSNYLGLPICLPHQVTHRILLLCRVGLLFLVASDTPTVSHSSRSSSERQIHGIFEALAIPGSLASIAKQDYGAAVDCYHDNRTSCARTTYTLNVPGDEAAQEQLLESLWHRASKDIELAVGRCTKANEQFSVDLQPRTRTETRKQQIIVTITDC